VSTAVAQKTIDYTYLDADAVKRGSIAVPPLGGSLPDFPSFFLFAFAKSGSVLVNELVRDLLDESGVPIIDLPTHLFENGIDINAFQCDLAALFPLKGYCFSGFRVLPQWLIGSNVLRRVRKMIVVRDPRDMLVSLYYSLRYSHWFPAVRTGQLEAAIEPARREAELSLDEFCIAYAPLYAAEFWKVRTVLRDDDVLVLRYEDFVYDKFRLAQNVSHWCGLNLSEERTKEIAAGYDVFPLADDADAHIRQVHPGDHRRKLGGDTIATLNACLINFLQAFSYNTAEATGLEKAP
jgi:hypothetical protein